MACDGDVKPVLEYDRDVRFRWLLPNDVLHVLARPASARQFLSDFFDPMVKTNLSAHDWKPSVCLALTTPLQIVGRAVKGTLFRPHGEPRTG